VGFRFRRSIGIIPGVRLNFGRRGTSVSLGVRGAHMTVGPTGVRKTVGIPGTGMSYTTHESWGARRAPGSARSEPEYHGTPTATTSGSSAGWIVAGILFVLLLIVVASS